MNQRVTFLKDNSALMKYESAITNQENKVILEFKNQHDVIML